MNWNQILHGGDYNPEQWLDSPEILEKDMEYMQKAGINTVTMGMFSWAMLEPEEGNYQIGWLEEIVGRLYENGISTILATPSGARPKWLAERYPEVLRVNADRVRNLFGGRHNHCYTAPSYREKVRQINTVLAEHFRSHPAVLLWHISNEYGGECHCPLCQEAFRSWLKTRYEDIGEVNRRWCTTFWSHRYQSFEQIESPSPIGEHEVHALTLEWKRFVTEQTADFIKEEIRALREAGAGQPTTVNLMYDYDGLNYDKLAECVDIVSWDSYPVWHKNEDILTAWDNGLQHDYMRGLKRQPYMLMESCPSGTNWQGISKLKKPGLLTTASLQAVAHGSDSVLYFQIRQSRGSSEKFHGAVIDHYGGADTRVFQEVSRLGRTLQDLAEVLGSRVDAKAAVIYDIENRWAIRDSQGPRNDGMYYHEAVMKSYAALRKQGINVDVISEAQKLEGYQLVVGPMLYLFREKLEEKIRNYVAQGGCFVMTGWSGIVDETDRCFLGGTPYGLMDVFGVRRTETDSLYDHENNWLVPVENGPAEKRYECRNLCDLLEISTAEPLFLYEKDFYAGTPAVVRNSYGKGTAYYIGADAGQDFYRDLYTELVRNAGIRSAAEGILPEGIEVSTRTDGSREYIFVQNYSHEPVDIGGMKIGGTVIYGEECGNLLQPYDTRIIRKI